MQRHALVVAGCRAGEVRGGDREAAQRDLRHDGGVGDGLAGHGEDYADLEKALKETRKQKPERAPKKFEGTKKEWKEKEGERSSRVQRARKSRDEIGSVDFCLQQ